MSSCPLCRARKARRACPALGHSICAVCCGTKRLTEIACPDTCVYLQSAREHPPAAAVRREREDLGLLGRAMRDLDEPQAALFFLACSTIRHHQPAALHPLADEDVAEATAALAATFETAERGVIYEHRPAGLPAERLVTALKGAFAEAGRSGRGSFGRDAGLVLRRIEGAARETATARSGNRRHFIDLLSRVLRREEAPATGPGGEPRAPAAGPPLIVP